MKRREFIKDSLIVGLGLSCGLAPFSYASKSSFSARKKILILGIDGMDPHLSRQYMRQGLMPNFTRLANMGSLSTVTSSIPPQSPVAWSNFSVGAPPKVHGIYDFIHRDPQTLRPYLSTSRVLPPDKTITLGHWKVPLDHGTTENLRQGKPFWEYLAERDIPTTIFKVPANFPCKSDKVKMVSGMGTPDLRGGYGNYTLFTTAPQKFKADLTGGRLIPVVFRDQEVRTELPGPVNSLDAEAKEATIPIHIWKDWQYPLVRIVIQDNELLLRQGEWSDWIQVSFPMLGELYTVKGICKLYVKSVHPEFSLYVSPLNIDPSEPALPVVTPEAYGRELVNNVGYFYTQGFPEDTKALSEGIFGEDEYLDLAYQIIRERQHLLDYEVDRFTRESHGLLFFYFSSLDQDTHMYWRTIDPHHPLYNLELHQKYGNTLKKLYMEMDHTLGRVLDRFDPHDPNHTIMVMSDHGFAPFRRQVNVNNWLFESGYLALENSNRIENKEYLTNINWSRTGAYSVGINSIYLNIKGRDKFGIVEESEAKSVLEQMRMDLLDLTDPQTGKKAVSHVRIVTGEEHRRHPHAPDLIVGWNFGYRSSWDSVLGGFSADVFADNLDKWSGDHCIDPRLVPAVLFTNRGITRSNPSLIDLTATILEEFAVSSADSVEGQPLYRI